MFIEVIPLDSSIDASGLTYFVPDRAKRDFSVGSIVEIPLRNSLSFAVVARMDTEAPDTDNIRSIANVICAMPILAPYETETILSIAERYFVHAHVALSLFLPHSLLRYLEKKSFVALNPSDTKIPKRKTQKTRFIHCQNQNDLSDQLHTILAEDASIAVVFPDDFALDAFLRTVGKDTKDSSCPPDKGGSRHGGRGVFDGCTQETFDLNEAIFVHDRLTETQRHKRFIDAYNGEKKQIIWTRRVLYYNLSRYDRIVYVEDALCPATMRFQHTYKNTDVLDRITALAGFETIILSTLPSIESLYKGHVGIYKFNNK